ncbi:MAG: hypothetical protein ACI8Y4_004165 [Candidatus Poriferisodalaceae bacterium]|jgi:hypothetical protein
MEYLTIRTPEVVHETVDGEAVIINLDKGLYFSADKMAACIWSRIAAGHDADSILAWGSALFTDVAPLEDEFRAFLDSLKANDLVAVSDQAPVPSDVAILAPPADYASPELEVFSDMTDLLLLDPIHDVAEELGWPSVAG